MSTHSFMFTYSVSPNGDSTYAEKTADKVRRSIASIHLLDWQKLDHVETTFAGYLQLKSFSTTDKRAEALEFVTDQMRSVLLHAEAFNDVWVSVALMVDGLGRHQEFVI